MQFEKVNKARHANVDPGITHTHEISNVQKTKTPTLPLKEVTLSFGKQREETSN